MKICAKNCSSEFIFNEVEAISASYVGTGNCMRLKKRKFVFFLRLSNKTQFWKDQWFLNICVKFHLRIQNIRRENQGERIFAFSAAVPTELAEMASASLEISLDE